MSLPFCNLPRVQMAEERYKEQDKELQGSREAVRKAQDAYRELMSKSKKDEDEIAHLNHEIVTLQARSHQSSA